MTAVLGTHTHVQTSDARVLAGGTAAITDAGMTGPHDSVIGSDEHNAIKRFVTGMPTRLEPATGDVRIEGVLVECNDDGRATSCELVRVPSPEPGAARMRGVISRSARRHCADGNRAGSVVPCRS